MAHNVNLNIHYSAPKEVWDRIYSVYRDMPYWSNNSGCARKSESRRKDITSNTGKSN